MMLILFMLLAKGIVGDVYECRSQQITLEDDIGFSIIDKQMAQEKECKLTFTWSDEYIAVVRVKATMGYSENIFISSYWGQTIEKTEYNLISSTTAWPPNSVTVTIRTVEDSQMMLTLLVERQKFSVANSIKQTMKTVPNQQPFYIDTDGSKPYTAITIESETQVALSKAAPENTDQREWANTFVYDRIGSDLVFRGTLYSLSTNNVNIISKTNGFTLYFAYPTFDLKGTIVANDYANVNFLSNAHTIWSQSDEDVGQSYFLDASRGTAALTILSESDGTGPIYVTKVNYLSGNAPSVDLLAGGCVNDPVAAKSKLTQYNESTINLPQFVPGRARTFILSQGMTTVSFTAGSSPSHAQKYQNISGTTGFIMSNNYPFMSHDQDSSEFVFGNENGSPFALLLDFPYNNSNKDAYLNISLKGEPGVPDSQQNPIILPLTDLTNHMNVSFTASKISVKIYGGQEESTGTYFTYVVTPGATTSTSTTTSTSSTTSISSSTSTSSATSTTSTTYTTSVGTTIETTTPFAVPTTVTFQLPETTLTPVCDRNFTATANISIFSQNYENQRCNLRIHSTKGYVFVNFTGTSKDAKLKIIDLNTAEKLHRPANDILETSTPSLEIEINAEKEDVMLNIAYKYIDTCENYCGADTECALNAAGNPYCSCLNICDQPNSDGLSCSPVQCSKVFKSKNCDPVQNGCRVLNFDGFCTHVCDVPKQLS